MRQIVSFRSNAAKNHKRMALESTETGIESTQIAFLYGRIGYRRKTRQNRFYGHRLETLAIIGFAVYLKTPI